MSVLYSPKRTKLHGRLKQWEADRTCLDVINDPPEKGGGQKKQFDFNAVLLQLWKFLLVFYLPQANETCV